MYENRLKPLRNPLIGYLNINSLINKIAHARVFGKLKLDYFALSETKLDNSFPRAQFYIENFEIRNRRDRDKNGDGLIEFVRKGLITKKIKEYESKVSETITSEFTISKKKWFCLSVYRPPTSTNLDIFFKELINSLRKAVNKYDDLIVMGDFNTDLNKTDCIGFGKLEEFCDNFNLTNIVKSNTCFTKNNKSTIDLLLTNKPISFQVINTTETGLSDCLTLIPSFMKSYISRLKPKTIFNRNYKNFDEEKFVKDVKAADFSFSSNDPNENYSVLSDTFSKLVDRHAPLKMKIQRGNHALFICKEMRKAIYARSRLRNEFSKNRSEENKRKYKRQRNLCVSLRRKAIKQYFSNITSKGIVTNKEFWKTIRPFLTNKGCLENSDIMLINDDEIVTDDKTLAKTFNEHYINTVERPSGLKPAKMEFENSINISRNILHSIIDRYKNHPSILKIKSEVSSKSCSDSDFSRNISVTSDEV